MDRDYIGPIQMLVVGFGPDAEFRGAVLDELDDLTKRGMIRVIDLQFVRKMEDGEVLAIETTDLSEEETVAYGAVIGGLIGLGMDGVDGAETGMEVGALAAADRTYGLQPETIRELADGLATGEAVAILLMEHVWAARLKYALRSTGAYPIAQGFLTPEALLMIGRELEAIVEAEATIEIAEAVKGAAIIDALATVEAAEELKSVAAAQALRALIVADLIEDYAAQEALDALVAAGLISQAAMAEAERSAFIAEAETAAAVEEINAALDASN